MKKRTIIWILIGVVVLAVILLIGFKLGTKDEKKSAWDAEVEKLINEGCIVIQVDGDGNTCTLNEEKNGFFSCTERLTTISWDLPKCVEYNK